MVSCYSVLILLKNHTFFYTHTVTPMVYRVYPEDGQMNYTVNETDTVTFECSATGIPSPTITWLRNGMELNDTTDSRVAVSDPTEMDFSRDNDGEIVSMVTRTLNLINTTDGDSGIYTCMTTNDADRGRNTTDFELIVQGLYIFVGMYVYMYEYIRPCIHYRLFIYFSQLLQ